MSSQPPSHQDISTILGYKNVDQESALHKSYRKSKKEDLMSSNKQNAILPKYKTVSLKFSPIYHKSPFLLEQRFENERPHLSKHMKWDSSQKKKNCRIIKILLRGTEGSRMWPGCL